MKGTLVFARAFDGIPAWKLALRVLWVAIEITLVLWLGQKGAYFVYQGF